MDVKIHLILPLAYVSQMNNGVGATSEWAGIQRNVRNIQVHKR